MAGLAERFASDPDGAKRIALWYILSMETFSPSARAVLLADMGHGELAYGVLVQNGLTHAEAWRQRV